MEELKLAEEIYLALKNKGAGIGNASIPIIKAVLDTRPQPEVLAVGWVQPEHLQISKEQGVRLVITKKSYHSSAIPVKLIAKEK